MKVIGLISGGKDSTYNLMQCVALGHEIVALANIRPAAGDDLNSYMYQTVGHEVVDMYAEAMDVPLFCRFTLGTVNNNANQYVPTNDDEVEDLYYLLQDVMARMHVEAVAVGAILSNYQRLRVENVCSRLGLKVLAFLWQRDQAELLQEMIQCKVDAVIVKVAAMGLDPMVHLGMRLPEIEPHMLRLRETYSLNICGEGGEYETFTLDCPLFKKRIVIESYSRQIEEHIDISPVGFLKFKKFHLRDKIVEGSSSAGQDAPLIPKKIITHLLSSRSEYKTETKLANILMQGTQQQLGSAGLLSQYEGSCEVPVRDAPEFHSPNIGSDSDEQESSPVVEQDVSVSQRLHGSAMMAINRDESDLLDSPTSSTNATGWTFFGGILGQGRNYTEGTQEVLAKLRAMMMEHNVGLQDMVAVILYVGDMTQYELINAEYARVFCFPNPPVRICVEAPLPEGTCIVLEGVGIADNPLIAERLPIHVQGISHWAPANIGPYSQAYRVNDVIYVAGQIGLIPATMRLILGGVTEQCRLALRHVSRIINSVDPNTQLRDVVQGICYLTHPSYIPEARCEWERNTNNTIVDYVVIPRLPRGALIEWHVWAHRHNSQFEYEETGCCVGTFTASIRVRWNYENSVSAVVCSVTTDTFLAKGDKQDKLNDDELLSVMTYTLLKLLRSAPNSAMCSLKLFCKIGMCPAPQQIEHLLTQLSDYDLVYTVIPVIELITSNTILSICGIRHSSENN